MLFRLAALVLLAAPAPRPAEPVKYPPVIVQQLVHNVYVDRQRSEDWLRQDAESYLAAVQRVDFHGRKTLTVGSAADNDLRIDDPLILPHHLRITSDGDRFHIAAVDDSARFRVEKEIEVRDTTLGPSSVMIGRPGFIWGRYNLRLSQQHDPALILTDGMSERFKNYHGLKHYPANLTFRYTLPMTANPTPDTIQIASTQGRARPALRMGWFDFMVGKTACRLTVIRMLEPGVPADNLLVIFKDATSGTDTWPQGRLLEVKRLGTSLNYLLDFNYATNPACAFSDLYNCPLPPRENVLKVAITAGEKDLHYIALKKS